jgi:hypothetical protein
METTCSSETSVDFQRTKRQEQKYLHLYFIKEPKFSNLTLGHPNVRVVQREKTHYAYVEYCLLRWNAV